MSSVEQGDPTLEAAETAFGNKVRPSLQIALDDWFADPSAGRLSGRVMAIMINAEDPSANFVPTAIDHFTQTTGHGPKIVVDDKDKDVISEECKLNVDRLFAGRTKTPSEVGDALNKCETDSLEKFFVSTTRSVYYSWSYSDPGFPNNKAISMGVNRDLTGTRVAIQMSYSSGEADREFKARVDALAAALKAEAEQRNKKDF
jgi:hypothetical protein